MKKSLSACGRALRHMCVAPDPGRVRLRVATRAVLGIGLAVALAELAGFSLVASITAGLAALLAMFTVGDATVRGQAATTALLPLAGFPVLALATALHDLPALRDIAWLLVVFAGVYARRWGPRGHALGVFAFMQFFVTQFLHALPAQLPELYVAVLLALGAAGAVRFGLWCVERRLPPPPAPPAPLPGTGLARPTTRQAFQATAACAVALVAGHLVSPERWYWAVATAWWIFVNTASRGETLVRGFRRVLGTVTGIAAGLLVALPLGGAPVPTAALVAVCVFGIFYTAPLSYSWMMFFVTVMASLLYGLLGVLHPELLLLRFEETAVGALGAAVGVALVPVSTHAATNAWIQRAVTCVHACTTAAARRLVGDPHADPAAHAVELDLLLARARLTLAPLVHPLSPLRARKARARRVLALLDDCAREIRGLAAVAADPDASHDARLVAAARRVEAAVHALVPATVPPRTTAGPAGLPTHHPGAEAALAHLHGLERALVDLATPLRTAPRAPLVPAA